ncbi:MAG: S-methyl-5'-thioadenosine phosphorylase [Verrucomicrobiota bacterium]|nr:S-methyl-5'-thioadenosine phosphorylase [Verrucomicrobiota bacterium]
MEKAKIGIIGGSGLYNMAELTRKKTIKIKTPFGTPSEVFLSGFLSGREVVFLARHGKNHSLLPGELNHRANVWAMKKLGVAWIVSVSAVGSLQAKYPPRSIVFPDQFFDRTKEKHHTFFGEGIVAHVGFSDPASVLTQQILADGAGNAGAAFHMGGTYVNMEGPSFSTRAESLYYQRNKFDIIGMTNMAEAKLAREAEIAYAPMCFVTDYDCWHLSEEPVTADIVLANLRANAEQAGKILAAALPNFPLVADEECHNALSVALVTPKTHWPAKTVRKLKPILQKYL